jgi:signal peptidase I
MFTNKVTTKSKINDFWKEWKTTIFVLLIILIVRSSIFNWYNIPSSSMNPTLINGDVVTVDMLAYDIMLPFTNTSLKRLNEPEYADIVGVFINDTRYVKRVIAKPNDKIKMVNNVVYVNGIQLTQTSLTMDLNFLPLAHGKDKFKFKSYTETHSGHTYPIVKAYGIEDPKNNNNVLGFPKVLTDKIVTEFKEYTVPEGKYFVMGDNRNLSKDSRVLGEVDRENIIGKISGVAFNYKSLFDSEIPLRFMNDVYTK